MIGDDMQRPFKGTRDMVQKLTKGYWQESFEVNGAVII